MIKRKWLAILVAVLLTMGGGAAWRASGSSRLFSIHIEQHWKNQSAHSVLATDYRISEGWLWFREPDGLETEVNTHGRKITIYSPERVEQIRAKLDGAGK